MNSVMVGLKPVMKSRCRSWLLKKRLSLYSSDTEIEGVSVTGPRWAGGARSPNNSSGYAPTGGRWRPGAGTVKSGGGVGLGGRGRCLDQGGGRINQVRNSKICPTTRTAFRARNGNF